LLLCSVPACSFSIYWSLISYHGTE
jgi:hypothetical protein